MPKLFQALRIPLHLKWNRSRDLAAHLHQCSVFTSIPGVSPSPWSPVWVLFKALPGQITTLAWDVGASTDLAAIEIGK